LSDINNFYEPYLNFIGENFRQGRIPLWNPYPECGLPQIGLTSPSVFYPPNLVFAWLTFSQGLALTLLLHQLLAALGGYLLVLRLGWGRPAAIACGFILALNGYMFTLAHIYPLVATAAWIPLCLWSLLNVSSSFNGKNMLAVLLSSIFICMLIASGRPELFAPAFMIFAGVILVNFYQLNKTSGWLQWAYELMWRIAALAFGTLMAAPVILPAIEWTKLSPRAVGLPLLEALRWSANFYDLAAMVLQHPLGNVFQLNNPLVPLSGCPYGYLPIVGDAYVGPVVITLALFSLGDAKWHWKWVLLALLGLALTLSLGLQTPLMPWLFTKFPYLLMFRYPIKLIYFVVLALALMASRGLYLLLQANKGIVYPLVAGASLWLLTFFSGVWTYLKPEAVLTFFVPDYDDLLWQATPDIALAAVNAATLGIIFCAIAMLIYQKRLTRNLAACLVFVCLVGSMFYNAIGFDRYMAAVDFFEKPSYVKNEIMRLAQARGDQFVPRVAQLSITPLTVPAQYATKTKGTDFWAADRALYGRQILALSSGIHYRVPTLTTYGGPVLGDYDQLVYAVLAWSPQYSSPQLPKTEIPVARFCQMAAVEYAITQIKHHNIFDVQLLDPRFFKLVIENKPLNVRIYELADPLPRAYFTSCWTWLTHKQVMDSIANAQNSHFDPLAKTLVEHSKQMASDPAESNQDLPKAPPAVPAKFLSRQPEAVILQVTNSKPGFLILTDQYYPGWQASIDGKPTTIFRANAVMKSVFLAPGLHTVVFRYEPESLKMGILVALLAITLIVFLVFLGKRNEAKIEQSLRR
jgi:hypothetical protein